MATQSIPTLQQLTIPGAVPDPRRRHMSRRALSRPSVHTTGRRSSKKDQDWQDLVIAMLPLVKRVAFKIRQRLPPHVETDDLVADGVLGLLDAVAKFDSNKRVKLESYARHRIHGAILDGLRGIDPASRHLRRRNKQIQKLYRELEVKLGRPAQDEEMAGALGINLTQWHWTLNEVDNLGFDCGGRRLTAGPIFRQPSAEPSLLVSDPATAGPSAFDLCYRREQRDMLGRALSLLRERERQVIELYYKKEMTMREIADRLSVDESRVSQLHSAALARLKASVNALLHPSNEVPTFGPQRAFQDKELSPRHRPPD